MPSINTYATVRKELDKIRVNLSMHTERHVEVRGNEIKYFTPDEIRHYIPHPTMEKMHNLVEEPLDSENEPLPIIKMAIGPFGSGKSSACVNEIVKHSCEMPRDNKGIRKSLWAIIRNTRGDLESTTIPSFNEWLLDVGTCHMQQDPYPLHSYKFNDGTGIVEMTLMFIPLELLKDTRKLKSLQITGAWINEASEIIHEAFSMLIGRTGRYPIMDKIGRYMRYMIIDTNPPPESHWIYELFEKKQPVNCYKFKQPAGLLKNDAGEWGFNPDAENLTFLPPNYYMGFASTMTEEEIKVFCCGEYGLLRRGKMVYPEYNDDIHCVDSLEFNPEEPIYLGWDFGLTPACLIAQYYSGRLYLIKEFTTERSDLEDFAQNTVKPFLETSLFGYEIMGSLGDPSGETARDTDGNNCMRILRDAGIYTKQAKTNVLQPRLDAVRHFLKMLNVGKPAFILSRGGCPVLREGFTSRYYLKRLQKLSDNGNIDYSDRPDKTHPHSDIQDCLQYIALEIVGILGSKNDKVPETKKARSVW